jgi:hypothetical protein
MCYRLYHSFVSRFLLTSVQEKIDYHRDQYQDAMNVYHANAECFLCGPTLFITLVYYFHAVRWAHYAMWQEKQIAYWEKKL